MRRRKVAIILGTRPEVIKLAPVAREIERHPSLFERVLVTTAQHREMLDQVLGVFDLKPDIDLDLMRRDQGLADFASRSLSSLAALLAESKPDAVLIQGDTTTVMTAALASFYLGIPVGHVEAGLRSFDRWNPFPEEMNRRVAGCIADLHFAPTERARANLLAEGVAEENIFVTGNTIVDALQSIAIDERFDDSTLDRVGGAANRLLLVTAHRRENHGEPLRSVCRALKSIAARYPDVEIVYPVHLNPNVRGPVFEELGDTERIHLVEPVSYGDLLRLMSRCYFVLTDSGGIQEEAPSFHKPVLVLREVTERPEVIEANAGRLIGTETDTVVAEVARLLDDRQEHSRMSAARNPFGDGHAAERIIEILARRL
jgi:UDP-N-acetylglucosamine 2-epimerase (non-hydrolysing)